MKIFMLFFAHIFAFKRGIYFKTEEDKRAYMTFLDCMDSCKSVCDQDSFFSDTCETCMVEKNCAEPENHMRNCTNNHCHDTCQIIDSTCKACQKEFCGDFLKHTKGQKMACEKEKCPKSCGTDRKSIACKMCILDFCF